MLNDYLRAGYPVIYLVTSDPHSTQELIQTEGWQFLSWDCISGVNSVNGQTLTPADPECIDPLEALKFMAGASETVLIAHNLHRFFTDYGEAVQLIQAIQNGYRTWKTSRNCLVILSPVVDIPTELQPFIHVLDMPLPDEQRFLQVQKELTTNVPVDPVSAFNAKGLTEMEAETAFALSLIRHGQFHPKTITETKRAMLAKGKLIQMYTPKPLSSLGGLQPVIDFFNTRKPAFAPGSKLPAPKAILLTGVPGCGKSLFAQVVASLLNRDLLKLDFQSAKGSLVGESEKNLRTIFAILKAYGLCVVWMDEFEKALAGAGAPDTGDPTLAMLGLFLTFMQEDDSADTLIIATANRVNMLPAEMMRRFDETFFVDLPSTPEREQIVAIMNNRYGTAHDPAELAARLAGYSGAEIEKVVRNSLFDPLDQVLQSIYPVSKSMKEQIDTIRAWAKGRARIANTPEPEQQVGRRIVNF